MLDVGYNEYGKRKRCREWLDVLYKITEVVYFVVDKSLIDKILLRYILIS